MFHIVERLQAFFLADFHDGVQMRAFRRQFSASGSTRILDTADSHNGEYTDLWQLTKLTGASQTKQISMLRPLGNASGLDIQNYKILLCAIKATDKNTVEVRLVLFFVGFFSSWDRQKCFPLN